MAKARKDNKGRALRKGETYRKSDNTYMYKYVDPVGRKKYIYSNDLLKLREREKELIKDQLDGLDVYIAGKATVNFVFDRYMSIKTELRQSTRSNYLYSYDRYVRQGFGMKKIADVKYSHILGFYKSLMTEQGLSVSTVDTVNTVLSPTFKLAVRDDIIRKNPCDGIMGEIKRKAGDNGKKRHALTEEQQSAFIDFIDDNPFHYKWHPLFAVMLGTGMRIGEVLGLRWEDVDLENRSISVNHALTYYPKYEDSNKSVSAISLPKTKSGIRTIPIIDSVADAFEEQRRYDEESGGCISEIDGMKGFIFYNRYNEVHKPGAVNKAIKIISENYNADEIIKAKRENREPVILPHFSNHILRHTFCTRLCEADVNIKVIQEIMGHRDIQTTMNIYAEVTESVKRKVIEEFVKRYRDLM